MGGAPEVGLRRGLIVHVRERDLLLHVPGPKTAIEGRGRLRRVPFLFNSVMWVLFVCSIDRFWFPFFLAPRTRPFADPRRGGNFKTRPPEVVAQTL